MISPIQIFLGICGYAKIPKETITIAINLELGYEKLTRKFPDLTSFKQLHEEAGILTKFLRSGHLLEH